MAATPADEQTLTVAIAFTRYAEGNAFARFMLAGLGQIHIDAEVSLEDRALEKVLGKSEGFAEAVAKVVLGQPAE